MSSEDSEQLKIFLNKSLSECMTECNERTQELIIKGHKDLEPHLIKQCDNISSKDDLCLDINNAINKLQKRINDRFITKYQEFLVNNILFLKDDPFVTNNFIKPSPNKYQSYDKNLGKEKNELYKTYIKKQKILKQLNQETISLQNQFNNTLKSINDNYQKMKYEIHQQHQKLLNQCQLKFEQYHQTNLDNDNNNISNNDKSNCLATNQWKQGSFQWDKCEISAVLPL